MPRVISTMMTSPAVASSVSPLTHTHIHIHTHTHTHKYTHTHTNAQVGLAASNALADEEAPQLQLSLVANLVSGYMRQCKVVSDFKVDPTADGEKIR